MFWDGDDSGLGIISRLDDDTSIDFALTDGPNLEIRDHPDDGCWLISTHETKGFLSKDPQVRVSTQLWECYQTIARHLLATPLSRTL